MEAKLPKEAGIGFTWKANGVSIGFGCVVSSFFGKALPKPPNVVVGAGELAPNIDVVPGRAEPKAGFFSSAGGAAPKPNVGIAGFSKVPLT